MEGSRSKKKNCTEKNEEAYENGARNGRWEGLNFEILGIVLSRIPAEQRIGVASVVCKSWRACIGGPYCWEEIDIDQWCRKRDRTVDQVNSAVRKLVRRSSKGTFRRLSAYKLGDAGFAFTANCGRFLKVLQIPMSDVTDKMVEKHAESLANMTVLDISYCLKITSKGLEAFGKNCKALIHLRRNMPPPEVAGPAYIVTLKANDCEAMVIADTMPGLQQLELGYGRFGDCGLGAILAKCKVLTNLDIQGCWSVKLGGDLEDRCFHLVDFKSPWFDDFDNGTSSDNDSDGADDDGESSLDLDDGESSLDLD